MLRFEWDQAKASSNERKHGVSFSEAATAFGDALSIDIPDPEHSIGEARFILLGLSYSRSHGHRRLATNHQRTIGHESRARIL